jgi:hypothetical protein
LTAFGESWVPSRTSISSLIGIFGLFLQGESLRVNGLCHQL